MKEKKQKTAKQNETAVAEQIGVVMTASDEINEMELDEMEVPSYENDELDELDELDEMEVPSDEPEEITEISDKEIEIIVPEKEPEAIINPVTKIEPLTVAEAKQITEIANKSKIRAIKRAIENKSYALDREKSKVRDWRVQGKDRIERAKSDYENRKKELLDLLKKTEERYIKRTSKTQKMWLDYSDAYEVRKINAIENDITLLQTELKKYELPETATEIAK